MKIIGFIKTSLLDWDGHVVAVHLPAGLQLPLPVLPQPGRRARARAH